mmetsp:Transcript_158/g.236  ORF Transcript_158/g.236 Transcript_158/m.236 type:complete len:255 (-) Transcript_158:1039-1803(-)
MSLKPYNPRPTAVLKMCALQHTSNDRHDIRPRSTGVYIICTRFLRVTYAEHAALWRSRSIMRQRSEQYRILQPRHLGSNWPAGEDAAGLLQKLHLSVAPMLMVASSASPVIFVPGPSREPPVTTRPASFAGATVILIDEKPGGRAHRAGSLAKRAIARAAAAKNGQLSCGGGLPQVSAIASTLADSSGSIRRNQQGTTSPVGSLVARGSRRLAMSSSMLNEAMSGSTNWRRFIQPVHRTPGPPVCAFWRSRLFE